MSGLKDDIEKEWRDSLKIRERYARLHLLFTALISGFSMFAAGYWQGVNNCKSLAEKLKDFIF